MESHFNSNQFDTTHKIARNRLYIDYMVVLCNHPFHSRPSRHIIAEIQAKLYNIESNVYIVQTVCIDCVGDHLVGVFRTSRWIIVCRMFVTSTSCMMNVTVQVKLAGYCQFVSITICSNIYVRLVCI